MTETSAIKETELKGGSSRGVVVVVVHGTRNSELSLWRRSFCITGLTGPTFTVSRDLGGVRVETWRDTVGISERLNTRMYQLIRNRDDEL